MSAFLVTAPTKEPVDLDEAKAHLRLETTTDDVYVESLVSAARQWVEEYCRRGLVVQVWEEVLPEFPVSGVIELQRGSLCSVTIGATTYSSGVVSVKYLDGAGVERTLDTTEYVVDGTSPMLGRVRLGYDKTWPTTRAQWDAVRVRYAVGWEFDEVPAPVKQACLLLVSQMYEHRTPEVVGTIVSKVQFAVEALLAPYRVPVL